MQERLAYEVYLNIQLVRIFSSGAHLGEVETEKSTITLKYATDAERISKSQLYIMQIEEFWTNEQTIRQTDEWSKYYMTPGQSDQSIECECPKLYAIQNYFQSTHAFSTVFFIDEYL